MYSSVIKIDNLSKQYRLGQVGTGTISHDVNRWWHKVRGKEDPYLKIGDENDRTQKGESDYVWALKNFSLEVNSGEVLGIIGKNGAGKSTLLKLLSRTTSPTTGSIKIKGKIASLLEVGTGFHPELSGRENIYLNGAILGMSKKEITSRFDEIVDFSGVERYIDTPVKRYSSGMYVRLAFAVAAHLDPDILIVDEVLAVGDFEFQQKCLGKMNHLSKQQGKTVLFVSHQMNAILSFCTSAVILENGKMKDFSTNVEEIVHKYSTGYQNKSELSFEWNEEAENQDKGKEISPKHLWLTNENGTLINSTIQRSSGRLFLNISLSIREKNPLHNIGFELIKFENRNEVSMFYSFHSDLGQMEVIEKGDYIYKIEIPISYFNEGEYAIKFLAGVHFQYWIFPPDISNSCFLTFSIRGGLSDSPYWIEKRPGVIAPALKWQKN